MTLFTNRLTQRAEARYNILSDKKAIRTTTGDKFQAQDFQHSATEVDFLLPDSCDISGVALQGEWTLS